MGNVGPLAPAWAGSESVLNITAATLITVGRAMVGSVSILVAGSAAGTVNDAASTAAANAANAIIPLPTTVSSDTKSWVVKNGIVVVPGTGQTIAITFSL